MLLTANGVFACGKGDIAEVPPPPPPQPVIEKPSTERTATTLIPRSIVFSFLFLDSSPNVEILT
jgi:hypothetical protein